MIDTYMYVCICICMYSTYISCTCYLYFYMNYIFTTLNCLYTTYTTRLQIDRHYLCTTYILPYIYIQHLCTTCLDAPAIIIYFPIQHMQPPSHPNPLPRKGWGDRYHVIPWPWVGEGEHRTWNIYIYMYTWGFPKIEVPPVLIHW